jgi:hypothetical protein
MGETLWHAVFPLCTLPFCRFLSGLVDVEKVLWDQDTSTVVFVVRRKDGRLFDTLTLSGVPAEETPDQPLLVDLVGMYDTMQI